MDTPNDTTKPPFEETEAYKSAKAKHEAELLKISDDAMREMRWSLEDETRSYMREIEDLRAVYDRGEL